MKSAQPKKNEKAAPTTKETAKSKPAAKEEKVKTDKKENKSTDDGPKIKRPLSGYFIFMNEMRPKMKKDHPDLKGKDVNVVRIFD